MAPRIPSKITATTFVLICTVPFAVLYCICSLWSAALIARVAFCFSQSDKSLAGCLIAGTMAACTAPSGQSPKTYEVQWVNPSSGVFNDSEHIQLSVCTARSN